MIMQNFLFEIPGTEKWGEEEKFLSIPFLTLMSPQPQLV